MNDNELCTFDWLGSKLTLTDTGRTGPMGHHFVTMRLEDEGRVIFDGKQMGVPAGKCIDDLDAVITGLFWLTVKPGDTDPEFFKDYTEAQLAWVVGARADELSMLASDYETRQQDSEVRKYFKLRKCPECGQLTPIYTDCMVDQSCGWCGTFLRKGVPIEPVMM